MINFRPSYVKKGAKELEHNEAEELLAKRLTEKKPEDSIEDAEVQAVKRLPPRWEIRIQAERDPVVEETKAYRAIAREVDGRYDNIDEGQSR